MSMNPIVNPSWYLATGVITFAGLECRGTSDRLYSGLGPILLPVCILAIDV